MNGKRTPPDTHITYPVKPCTRPTRAEREAAWPFPAVDVHANTPKPEIAHCDDNDVSCTSPFAPLKAPEPCTITPPVHAIDYHDLLRRYIAHVVSLEGWDYIRHGEINDADVEFTAAERLELKRLAEKAWSKR